MEECLITKRKLPEEQVVYTLDGPVAAFLWGRNKIKMNGEFALIPDFLAQKYCQALGKEPNPEVFETPITKI